MHSQVAALSKKAGVSINAFIKAAVQKEIASML
jgi:predicted HicB family RNase H-like nuclease